MTQARTYGKVADSEAKVVDIKARQDPLRERYKVAPEEALITDRGRTLEGELDDTAHIWVAPGGQDYGIEWKLGVHRAVGGLHDLPNPGDMLCTALAVCMDSVIRMVANRHGVVLEDLEVDVAGDVDVRGTLVVSRDVRVGFQRMRCGIRVKPTADTDRGLMERLLKVAEHCCVNLDTLRNGVEIEIAHQVE